MILWSVSSLQSNRTAAIEVLYIFLCSAEFRWNATFMDYSARVAYDDDSGSYGYQSFV